MTTENAKNIKDNQKIKILDKSLAIYAKQSMECDRVIKEAKEHKEMCMEKLKEAMGNHTHARLKNFNLNWGLINYKAQPEKIIPAKEAYSIRKKTITIKEF
jgi:hypothetical protein